MYFSAYISMGTNTFSLIPFIRDASQLDQT